MLTQRDLLTDPVLAMLAAAIVARLSARGLVLSVAPAAVATIASFASLVDELAVDRGWPRAAARRAAEQLVGRLELRADQLHRRLPAANVVPLFRPSQPQRRSAT